MAESQPQKSPELCPAEEPAIGSPNTEECPGAPEKLDPVESPSSKPDGTTNAEQRILAEESGDEQALSSEKEEEQTFLVNLYKFMKERHTPIERVPHLGFKQINLFKIYKVVEELGAYELVTGRRLWKNVYDLLGGSPGSTSAATCTRRHYERLVLPYVRHLKGEDDKPLPPIKPRKQYKVSKEPKGEKAGSSSGVEKKRVKKEKSRDQVPPEKPTAEALSVPQAMDSAEQGQPSEQAEGLLPFPSGQEAPASQPPEGCHGNCRAHGYSEAYKRLFSSFYFKGNHGIMSPLAKKKLLAQVSKAESLYCHEKHLSHCPEYKKARSREIPGASDPEAGCQKALVGHHHAEVQNSVLEGDRSSSPAGPSHVSKANETVLKISPVLKESHVAQKPEDGSSGVHRLPGPPVLTGYFHTYRSDIMKPISCHPLRGPVEYYSGFKPFPEAPSAYQPSGKDMPAGTVSQKRQEDPEEQPEDLRRKPREPLPSWRGDGQQPSAFQRSGPSTKRGPSPFLSVKASWVPPGANLAKVSPQAPKNGSLAVAPSQTGGLAPRKRTLEVDVFVHGKKLKAVPPLVQEVEPSERGTSPSSQQGVAKPKAGGPNSGFPAAPGPQVQDMYKGTMLRLPVNFSSRGDHLKGQSSPSLIPSLSVSPFIIPAFPTPLLTASLQPSDLCQPLGTNLVHYPTSYDSALRHRLYPVSTWHSQPAYASPHVPTFHRNTKL
ncbi:AT-rich interactive domain-containing protein 5A isoform X2 [Hemicordylus capensis]|nr:AT-rich interactive domain-containing protein 5A isoform X2 [Hemicordylus capensis]